MKWAFRIIGGLVAVCVALVAALAIYLFATALRPARPVGFQQAMIADPGRAPIPVSIWYPTDAKLGFVLLGFTGQRVASGGRVTGADLPLVVISHGTGGGAMSHIDTAMALAEAGFVVAAPTHPGDNFQDDSAVGTTGWLVNRSRDLSRVTDFMIGRWDGHSGLDPRRIGVFGFSAGATTALIAAGGTPDLGRIAPQCAEHPEFVCQLRKAGTTFASPPPSDWTHEPRFAAAVIAAPGLGFTFEPDGLSKVRLPVQLWSGAADASAPYATNAGTVRRLLPIAPEFHSVAGASHYAFLAPCGLIGPPVICRDAAGFDRDAFHESFNAAVVGFFKAHLPAHPATDPEGP